MKMHYRLNGKEISLSEYLMAFQGMTKWIESQVLEAIDGGGESLMLDTNAGPLVITVLD